MKSSKRCFFRKVSLVALVAFESIQILFSGQAAASSENKGAKHFDWGARLRIRQEYLANVFDFSRQDLDDRNYIRVRPQIWASYEPKKNLKLFAMITNEHRHWFKSERGYEKEDFEINEFIFENLYIEAHKLWGSPFGFKIGRQNLFYGEGFVCWDGGPLDGSRTAYFNALVLEWALDKRRLEVHAISDPKRDEYLPVLNDADQQLIEWKETGAGLYYIDESHEKLKIESYYFLKHEKYDRIPASDCYVNTVGIRISRGAKKGFSFAAEEAIQFGYRGSQHELGYGANAWAKFSYTDTPVPIAAALGAIVLSGDDRRTYDLEGWNPVYARWPKWSELLIYTFVRENGAAYWTNLLSFWLGLEIPEYRNASLEWRLYPMWSFEPNISCTHSILDPEPICTGPESHDRGILSTLILKWRSKQNLSGHLLWEAFKPGDYYPSGDNTAHFLRWEVILSI